MMPSPDARDGPKPPPEAAIEQAGFWKLLLFVAGQGPKSLLAYANLKKLCEQHIRDQHTIEVIDLAKQPALAKEYQVIAVPTLVRENPAPQKRIIGNLSNQERMAAELDLHRL